MKRIYQSVLVVVIALVSFKCQKELSRDHLLPGTSNSEAAPITATLQGNILDENGLPAAGVKISVGAKTAITNSHGYFRITDASLDKNASLVTAEQTGYFKAYRNFSASAAVNQVVIQLIKKTLAGTIDAAAGGSATLANGAKIFLPANGIIKATGAAFSGSVKVYAAYIDPTSTEIGKTIPGSLKADDKDKNRVVLSSFGMLAVELESSAGEKLQVATGSAATLTMPIPATRASAAPASIPLWYIDEQTGIWKEQGTARKNGNSYTGEVKHFSYWNCDTGLPGVGFSVAFTTLDGVAVKNMYVTARTVRNANDSSFFQGSFTLDYSDSLGRAGGMIPANMEMVLEVRDGCYNVVFSKNIGPFSQNTDFGTLVIPDFAPSLVTVKGKLLNCNNTAVTDGYVMISWNNMISYAKTDADGKFSTNIFTCSGAPQVVEIIGVDAAVQQQGSRLTIPFTPHITDAGDIVACGTSSVEFINYKVDGVAYTVPGGTDSLSNFYWSTVNTGTSFDTYVRAGYPPSYTMFSFSGDNVPGIYPLDSLAVIPYNRIGLKRPFNITITSFAKNPGDFYEGNFSGTFVDSTAISVTHNINCSFRIRK